MALVIALLAVGVWALTRSSTVEIDAWRCSAKPGVDQSLTAIESANCRPGQVGATIEVLVDGQQVEGLKGTEPVSIPSQIEDPSSAVLRVTLKNPSSGIVLADTRARESVPGRALRGERDGLVWETSYQPGNGTSLVLLVGPEPEVEALN